MQYVCMVCFETKYDELTFPSYRVKSILLSIKHQNLVKFTVKNQEFLISMRSY